jgi:hypothetical protein
MDKLLHFFVGIIIGMAVTMCTGSLLFGVAAALAIGMLKEFWDLTRPDNGVFDFWDIFWTLIGGLLGAGFSFLCIALGGICV